MGMRNNEETLIGNSLSNNYFSCNSLLPLITLSSISFLFPQTLYKASYEGFWDNSYILFFIDISLSYICYKKNNYYVLFHFGQIHISISCVQTWDIIGYCILGDEFPIANHMHVGKILSLRKYQVILCTLPIFILCFLISPTLSLLYYLFVYLFSSYTFFSRNFPTPLT